MYLFDSKRIVQKYSFIPREPMRNLADIDVKAAAEVLYGDICLVSDNVENDSVDVGLPKEDLINKCLPESNPVERYDENNHHHVQPAVKDSKDNPNINVESESNWSLIQILVIITMSRP